MNIGVNLRATSSSFLIQYIENIIIDVLKNIIWVIGNPTTVMEDKCM